MADVFISYKREDAGQARRLVAALRAAELSVWWDEDIPASAPWEATIERALAGAKAVIVCWSPESVASENVRSEARVAREDGRLVQVFLKPCSPPLFFGERQGVDLTKWRGRGDDGRIAKVVAAVRSAAAGELTLEVPAIGRRQGGRRAWISLGVTLFLVAIAAGGLVAVRQTFGQPKAEVAVLPFEDLSPAHDKAFFAEGVAEEILSSLSADSAVKVLGRASSRQIGRDSDPRALRRSLGVTHLLEGSAQTAGDTLRVNVRLIDTSDGSTVWRDQYDGRLSDVFAVQDKITAAVVKQVHGIFASRSPVRERPTTDAESYEMYLSARAMMRSRSKPMLQKALALAGQVVERQPKYAPGQALYAELIYHLSDDPLQYGDIPVSDARKTARTYALRAIELAPRTADGYAALGLILPREQAVGPLTRAIGLDSSRGELRMWLEEAYSATGDYDNAFKQAQLAVDIDPLWPASVNRLVLILAASRRFPAALSAVKRFEGMGGDPAQAMRFRGAIARRQGDHASSIFYGEQAIRRDPSLPYVAAQIADDYHLLGLSSATHPAKVAGAESFGSLFIKDQRPLIVEAARSGGRELWDAPDIDVAIFTLGAARAWGPLAAFYRKSGIPAATLCEKLPGMGFPVGLVLPIAQALAATGSATESRAILSCAGRRVNNGFRQSYRSASDYAAQSEADRAMTLAITGDKKNAVGWLARAIDLGWLGYPYSPRLIDWPAFDNLRDDPRLSGLQSRIDQRIARQRVTVLARRP